MKKKALIFGITGQDGSYLAEYLLNNAKVAVVPGIAFGKSPFFRLSYATSFDELKEACERIEFALKNFSL